jgi:hypothetical protein
MIDYKTNRLIIYCSSLIKKTDGNNCMQLRFRKLRKTDRKYWKLIEDFFIDQIQPLYGDQTKFLNKIREGIDRTTEILFCETRPVGIIVYKCQLSDEYASLGIEKALELKTICLFEKKYKTAGLFLRFLMGRTAEHARKIHASSIVGTISSRKPDVLRVMQKFGFDVMQTFKDKYLSNADEFLMCHRNLEKLVKDYNRYRPQKKRERIASCPPA